MHDEDGSALHRTVLLMRQIMQNTDEGFHRYRAVVLRTAASIDQIGKPVVQNRRNAHTADGKRRRTQETRERVTSRWQLHIADGRRQLLIGGTNILIVLLRILHGNLPPLFVLNRHRLMPIRMAANFIALRRNRAQEIRIVVQIPCDDEERTVYPMLAQHIENMIDGVIAAPIIKAQKNCIVRNGLDNTGTICLPHL